MIFLRYIMLAVLLGVSTMTLASEIAPVGEQQQIMVLSISSDGKYVISTNLSRHAVLWNLQQHTYKVLPMYPVNIYSAYFIKDTDDFLIQDDKTNQVLVENVAGKIIKKLNPGFPTYGEVMTSNLQNYFASDESYNVYKIGQNGNKTQLLYFYCSPNFHKPAPPKGMPHGCMGFVGGGKLMNLAFNQDDATLMGAGNGDVYLWSISTGKLLHHLSKNEGQTFATISPDGQYVVSGDADANLLLFSIKGKQLKTFDEGYNPATGQNFNKPDPDQEYEYDDDNSPNAYIGGLIIAVKFIDHTHFLMFTKEYGFYTMPQGFEYAALYSLSGSKAIKYLPLLSQQQKSAQTYATYPETQSFVRDQATDTSPSAHVLVMAMSEKNGILVYHYAPKTQTFKQVWAPVIAPTHWWHFW